jgi:DNA-binding NarL/FixJ family response regulator
VAPNTKIVAFGVAETHDEILALAAAGTAGYLRDDAEAKDVVGVLARIMRDELVCSPQATASLYHQVALLSHEGNDAASIDLLSRREQQIAQLISRGLSNKQIARELGIEATTVKNHVHRILEKLKVHRRSFVLPLADDGSSSLVALRAKAR